MQFSDYLLISFQHTYTNPAPVLQTFLFWPLRHTLGFLLAISDSWRSAIQRRHQIRFDIRGTLTSKYYLVKRDRNINFRKRLPDKEGYDIIFG